MILTDVNLNINKSHQGNFTQGQTGAEYTMRSPTPVLGQHRNGNRHRHPARRPDRHRDQRTRLELRAGHPDLHPL